MDTGFTQLFLLVYLPNSKINLAQEKPSHFLFQTRNWKQSSALHHGKVKEDFLDKWLEEAINVSLQYQVIELQEACRIHLYQKVTVENILDFLSLSKCLGCEKIVLKFVLSNVKALALESIKNMSYSDFILTCGEKLPRNFLSNGLESTPSQDPIISSWRRSPRLLQNRDSTEMLSLLLEDGIKIHRLVPQNCTIHWEDSGPLCVSNCLLEQ